MDRLYRADRPLLFDIERLAALTQFLKYQIIILGWLRVELRGRKTDWDLQCDVYPGFQMITVIANLY